MIDMIELNEKEFDKIWRKIDNQFYLAYNLIRKEFEKDSSNENLSKAMQIIDDETCELKVFRDIIMEVISNTSNYPIMFPIIQ